ncbi:MAG TPA: acyl carrier protein [Steroidobacteraceae bacterium]|jgi:acyl carrier protein|nr:acyl carrier protein [Steroidobacteraceae bacterium]
MKSRQEIFDIVRNSLIELFELDAPVVVPEARFDDDLEIDSIDAVDLVDHLSRIFERRVSPRDFRSVRTVQDLIDCIDRLQTQ